MHSSRVLLMARGKGKTVAIKMTSTAGTGFFYTTRKNVTKTPDKFTMIKFDPIVRRRVIFKEGENQVTCASFSLTAQEFLNTARIAGIFEMLIFASNRVTKGSFSIYLHTVT